MKAILLGAILLFCLRISAQTPVRANNAGFKLFFEKTYLHTDRDVYAQGDTLWYKAYLVNGQDNTPAKTSSTLYVDLIDTGAHVIRTEIIHLTDGLGNGDFDLPDNFAPGKYRLRAYTNWMRNFGDNFIFEKTISILDGKATTTVAPQKFAAAGKNKKITIASAAPAIATPFAATINFFPEGGSLIEGINAIVAVKAGDSRLASGAVVANTGDTVAHFTCDSLGMGMFALLPLKGQFYRAVVKGIAYPLPSALSKGLALQIRQTDSVFRVVISRSDTTFKSAKLILKHAGITVLSQQVVLPTAQVAARIPINGLPEGICSITIYDNQNRPQCERLIYIHHPGFGSPVNVKIDKPVYRPKEKVEVVITAEPNTSLSLAVADAATVDVLGDNIISNLMLGSELRGRIEHPARYFDTTNVNRAKQLDLLLLTQGWRDFLWRRISDTAIHISYAVEKGINLSGLVEDEVNHKPQPNSYIHLSTDTTKTSKEFSTVTDAKGRFLFRDMQLNGKLSAKLTAMNAAARRYGSFIVDSAGSLPVRPVITYDQPEKEIIINALKKRAADMKKIDLSKTKMLKEVTIKAKTPKVGFLTTYDKRAVHSDDGVDHLTWGLQENFDITPKDYWTKNLTWYVLQNSTRAVGSPGPDPGVAFVCEGHIHYPILVVNGSTFHIDYNLYWGMPIEKFKKIEIRQTFACGFFIFLTTIADHLIDNPGSLSTDVQGYYQAKTFYTPPPTDQPSLADYRTTIHWEPNVKTDANGKAIVSFYNAGSPAPIRVMVQGVTANGTPVSKVISYEVK